MAQELKDHRELGRELDLFSFNELAPGAIFWHPKGWTIYRVLEEFIRERINAEGYREISTPVMVKNDLFKKSGHWEHFGEHNMFNLAVYEPEEIETHLKSIEEGRPSEELIVSPSGPSGKVYIPRPNYSLRPMNCPEACLVYATKTRSYQDLPIKLSEFGILHRRELSGVLGGLFRVRQFIIDDAHLFVRPDQILEEIDKLLKLVMEFYASLDFEPHFYLATKPDKAMGDPKLWEEAEKDLEAALKKARVKYDLKPKEGAFYGPKIDIHIKDSQDRDWQLATIQLDFQMPARMELSYVDKDGKEKVPVMIHRAIFGSFERFIGILVEHFQGAFPVWLAPVQAVVLPITDRNIEYANAVVGRLKAESLRAELDSRSETLQARIRDAQLSKIPYMLVVGDKEEKSQSLSLRLRTGEDEGEIAVDKFIERAGKVIEQKSGL